MADCPIQNHGVVVAHILGLSNWNLRFESSVILNGSEATGFGARFSMLFESSVILNGSEA